MTGSATRMLLITLPLLGGSLVAGCGPVILAHSADTVLIGAVDHGNLSEATGMANERCGLFNKKARFRRFEVPESSPFSHQAIFDCVP